MSSSQRLPRPEAQRALATLEPACSLCEPAGRDEDCDGLIDDEDSDPIGQAEWYRDEDGDGLGDPEILVSACEAPEGFVDNADDCDDTRYLGDEDLDGEDDCSDDDIDGDGLRNEWDAGGLGCLRRRGSHARFRNGWAAPRSTSSPTPAG